MAVILEGKQGSFFERNIQDTFNEADETVLHSNVPFQKLSGYTDGEGGTKLFFYNSTKTL